MKFVRTYISTENSIEDQTELRTGRILNTINVMVT